MADIRFDGLGVALITPFHKDLSIDFEALGELIENLISGGCNYLVVLGTTAETPTLSFDEKQEVARYVREKTGGRIPLVLGIGGNNTSGVIEDINKRDLDGYSAILSVTPYYNKPTQEGLFLHYKAIAENSPLPIILYNVPGRTGVNLSSRTTIRLANLSDKIIGVKEASGNFDQCKEIIQNTPTKFQLISGDDAATCALMKTGGCGVISVLANAFPKEVKRLVNLCHNKEFEQAQIYQTSMLSLISHLFEDGNPAGVKSILYKMGRIENVLRLPLVPVSNEVEDKLERATKEFLQNPK